MNKTGKTDLRVDHGSDNYGSGLSEYNFRKIASHGFGDPYNAYPHSMTWFKDHLYVGTTRACLAYRGKWRTEDKELLGRIWPVKIPDGLFDIDLRAEIWRYHPPTDKWDRVYISPFVKGVDGFDVPLVIGFRCMTSFQGRSDSSPALYIPTFGSHQTPMAVMLRSTDGLNFEIVSEPGLGFPDPYKPRGVRALTSFNGRLYTSPAVGQKRKDNNKAEFMSIMVTDDPLNEKWQLACEPHFGDYNNLTVFDMAEFNGFLYAGTLNVNDGFQIWKTKAEGSPPFSWKKVMTHGAHRGRTNQIAMTMQAFGDHIYIGSAVQGGGCDIENMIGPVPPEIIRINADDSWDLVVGEARYTPDGFKVPLSGFGPGFGNPFAGYIWSMCTHDGWLYAGTFDWLVSLRFSPIGEGTPNKLRIMLSEKNVEEMIQRDGGFDLWCSRNGSQWTQVTNNGFNNYFNYGLRNMVSTPNGLFIGAANPFGPDVAVKRVAGWQYEENPRGGLEIWQGTHPGQTGHSANLEETSAPLKIHHLNKRRDLRKDEEYIEELIEEFYEYSGFCHLGYWRKDIYDAKAACENLMDEILAFIPEKQGEILDIGCGTGVTTKYLLKHFPAEAVTGITDTRDNMLACRETAPDLKFLHRELAKLKLPAKSFNFIIWVKGFLNQLGSRQELIQNSYQILKPGGQFICFDILSPIKPAQNKWTDIWGSNSHVGSIEEYHDILKTTGYKDIKIVDVTANTLDLFMKYRVNYIQLKMLSGKIRPGMLEKFKEELIKAEHSIEKCLLISCKKPEA